MSKGGYQPGSGRPERYVKYEGKDMTIKQVMELTGWSYEKVYAKYATEKVPPVETKEEIEENAASENKTPLEYMLDIMNNPTEDKSRRDRMAQAAAPYCHTKADAQKGKKDKLKDAAKQAGRGKFGSAKSPKVVTMGRKS